MNHSPKPDSSYHRAKRVFQDIVGFLEKECDGDVTIQSDVLSLLGHYRGASNATIDTSLAANSATPGMVQADHPDGDGVPDVPPTDYELLEELGRGGMGVVYKARQISLDRLVAVKMLHYGNSSHPSQGQQLVDEARTAANLHHPNIVAIHEFGKLGDQFFFSMDYVEGKSLHEIVKRKPPSVEQAIQWMSKVAAAIAYANSQQVFHRDIKPSNILLDHRSGEPRVTDFGLAITNDVSHGESTPFGTPGYIPPEFVNKLLGDSEVTASGMGRAEVEVYALGATLYCLLVGHPPHRGSSVMETLQSASTGRYVEPRELNAQVGRDLNAICVKSLHPDPQRRYRTVQALSDELQRVQRREPVLARPIGPFEKLRRWTRRAPLTAMLLLCFIASLLAGTAVSSLLAVEANKQAGEARQGQGKANRYAQEMEKARDKEKAARLEKEALLLGANASRLATESSFALKQSPSRALLLAVESIKLSTSAGQEPVAAAEAALWNALTETGGERFAQHSRSIWGMGLTKDNQQLISIGDDRLRIQSLDQAQSPLSSDALRGRGLAFAHQSNRVFTASGEEVREHDLGKKDPWFDYAALPIADGKFSLTSLRISPNDRWLVAGGWWGDVVVWDLKSEKRQHFPRVHACEDPIWQLEVNDNWILTRSNETVTRIELTEDGPKAAAPMEVGSRSRAIALSPNGRYAVTANNKEVHVWDLNDGEFPRSPITLRGHVDTVSTLAISHDSRQLATAGSDRVIRVWDLENGEGGIPKILYGHEDSVLTLAFSHEGNLLVSGGSDKTLRLWNVDATDPSATVRVIRGHDQQITDVTVSRDGSLVFSESSDDVIRVCRTKRSTNVAAIHPIAEFQAFGGAQPRLSPGGEWLLEGLAVSQKRSGLRTYGLENTVARMRRVGKRKELTLSGHLAPINHSEFREGNRWLFTASGVHGDGEKEDGRVLVRDTTSKTPNAVVHTLESLDNAIMGLWVSEDGKGVVAATRMGQVGVWKRDAAGRWSLSLKMRVPEIFRPQTNFASRIAISHDHRWLAAPRMAPGNANEKPGWEKPSPEILLCDLSGELPVSDRIRRLKAHQGPITSLAFSPRGPLLASAGERMACIWNVESKQLTPVAKQPTGHTYSVVHFSPKGSWLAVSSKQTLTLWRCSESDPPKQVKSLSLPQNVSRVAFAPDESIMMIVCAEGDNLAFMRSPMFAVKMTDPELTLRGWPAYPSFLFSLEFSEDSRYLAGGYRDKVVIRWQIDAPSPERTAVYLHGHSGIVTRAVFADDNRKLISTSDDASLRVWNMQLDNLIQLAKRTAGRELTESERIEYSIPARQ